MTTPSYERADLTAMFLPVGQMLQIDRVIEITSDRIVCEMDIGNDHWVFPLHFPDDPIFPGCLLIEAASQVVAIWGWHTGLRGRPRLARVSATFENPVGAGDARVTLRAAVRRRRNICLGMVEILAAGRHVAAVDSTLVIVPDADEVTSPVFKWGE